MVEKLLHALSPVLLVHSFTQAVRLKNYLVRDKYSELVPKSLGL